MDRIEIVTNGCSGNCCEAFTFPFSQGDLLLNREALAKGDFSFVDERGFERKVINDNSVDTIIDMLILVEKTNIDPQDKKNLTEEVQKYLENHDMWTGSFQTLGIEGRLHINSTGYEIEGEDVVARVYTCKHFDKEKRICGNYEGRPHMCKNFGHKCTYEGCSFQKNYWGERGIDDTEGTEEEVRDVNDDTAV